MRNISLILISLLISQTAYPEPAHENRLSMEDFAYCYGIVRYYSPNPYTKSWSEKDWYKLCSYMLDVDDPESLLQIVAPTMAISDEPMAGQVVDEATDAAALEHHGSGTVKIPVMARILYPSVVRYLPYHHDYVQWTSQDYFPDPYTYYSYKLPSGRYCNIVHCDSPSRFNKKATSRLLDEALKYWDGHCDPSYDSKMHSKIFGLVKDKSVRIADIIVRWNIIRHFYPYYEEDALDWENRLPEFISIAGDFQADDKQVLYGWLMLVKEFMNPVKDGHIIVQYGFDVSRAIASYVSEYYSECPALAVNDTLLCRVNGGELAIIDSIGHQSAHDYLVERKCMVNAATEKRRDWLVSHGLLASGTETSVEVCGHNLAGERFSTSISLSSTIEPPRLIGKKPPLNGQLGEDILYVDATSRDFSPKKVLKACQNGIGKIIFDLRGYPSYDFEEIIEHLTGEDIPYLTLSVPVSRFPFREKLIYEDIQETIKAKKPQITADIVFLSDESTISWGETILMLVKGYSMGTIIGSYTAGTNGDATRFDLPFFPFNMTGLRVSNIDGSMHHAVGVEPDICISNYAIDIIQGRDRILETAVNYLSSISNSAMALDSRE